MTDSDIDSLFDDVKLAGLKAMRHMFAREVEQLVLTKHISLDQYQRALDRIGVLEERISRFEAMSAQEKK